MNNLELSNEKILLVDWSNLVARTFNAFNTMTSDGRHTGMYFGTLKVLDNQIKKYKITKVFICMDKKPYWRKLFFPEYKQGRKGLESSLGDTYESYQEQINDLNVTLNHLGFNMFSYRTFEADDLISAAVFKYKKNNNIYIYSSDHDFLQLIDKNVYFIQPKQKVNDIIYTIDNFKSIMGMTPEKYLQVLAFAGDSSDAIPNIFGIKNGTEQEGYYWKNPPRVFTENKVKTLLSSNNNSIENLLEGKINPVKGIGAGTYNLFLNNKKEIIKSNYERNMKLINLRNGDKKLESIKHIKNNFDNMEIKKSVAEHFFKKYECNTLYLTDSWPYFSSISNVKRTYDPPEISKNQFSSLLNRRKK